MFGEALDYVLDTLGNLWDRAAWRLAFAWRRLRPARRRIPEAES